MVTVDNLVGKLCAFVLNGKEEEVEVKEWRLLGQEQDGTLLFTWKETSATKNSISHIGLFSYLGNKFETIHSLPATTNVIQATINVSRTLLGYVTKQILENGVHVYKPYLVEIGKDERILQNNCSLFDERQKQLMLQFLWHKQSVRNGSQTEKLLVLIHDECIVQYTLNQDGVKTNLTVDNFISETVVKKFLWAQWDAPHQTLYYIHYRKPMRSLVEGEESSTNNLHDGKTSPLLSGLQFHDDLPYESVLNIPLNLPHMSLSSSTCGIYEDDTVPLRIHDCSLDLIVLTDSDGIVCICHHYLYQPVQPLSTLDDDDDTPVNFAYSVTILHHGCVLHCVIPGIPWCRAKRIRPLFMLYDDYMLVFIPGTCTHLLDIGFTHEPSCHVVTVGEIIGLDPQATCLAFVRELGGRHCALNMPTLDVIDLYLPTEQLVQTFKNIDSLENKLSILHYLMVHRGENESVVEMIRYEVEQQPAVGLPQLFREFLIGNCFASVWRNLPSDASQLIELLPVTTQSTGCEVEIEVSNEIRVCMSQDALWNASMMLLSPQQRVVPFRMDVWVRLWERLIKNTTGKQKFRPSQVAEKLLVSLVCYQPEALSRSTTPMSPLSSGNLSNLPKDISTIKNPIGSLPFYEMESCTASKQEHIISVNLRELSMHLLKQSTENRVTRFQWQLQTPMHVHAVATRYIGAQLEQSRHLCHVLCKSCVRGLQIDEKGFIFIDKLPEKLRFILFATLEQYCLAVESVAFPLPLGFTSFFTFLGYRTLEYEVFLQYVQRHVFELQIDVMKTIMADMEDTQENVRRKLTLLSLLPRMRAKRLLSQWHHPVSLTLRAREHAANILSGVEGQNVRSKSKNCYQLGLTAFPTGNRLSPLDTFLDLLTAKASLNLLDFGLLIDATVVSTEYFF